MSNNDPISLGNVDEQTAWEVLGIGCFPAETEKRAEPNRKVNCSICGASGERWELYYDPVDDSYACVDLRDCHR